MNESGLNEWAIVHAEVIYIFVGKSRYGLTAESLAWIKMQVWK